MDKKVKFENIQIDLCTNKLDGLLIKIITERLFICPVIMEYLHYYSDLFSDSKAMMHYEYGVPFKDDAIIEDRIINWVKKWKNHNPYSGYAVFDKEKKYFIGHLDLEATEETNNGSVELGYIFVSKYWGNGIATEAASAIVNNLVPILLESHTVDQYPLKEIIATTKTSNIASQKILKKIGFVSDLITFSRYGEKRYKFYLNPK